jgi:hypothetical protein
MMAMVDNPAAAMRMGANVADPTQWISGVNMGDSGAVADRILWMSVQADVTAQQRQTIVAYLSTDDAGMHTQLTMENVDEKVRGAMSLAFALPSFQLA